MKSISSKIILQIFCIALVLLSYPVLSQNNTAPKKKVKQDTPKKSKPRHSRSVEYESLGQTKQDSKGKVKMISLTRKIKYSAVEAKTGKMHGYTISDGNKQNMANQKPEKCRVINEVTGLTVDEYSNEFTCNKHFGEAAYRQVIDKLVAKYVALYKSEIAASKGILEIRPISGQDSIEFQSPGEQQVELFANGRYFKAVASLDAKGNIVTTHTFIMRDPNKAKLELGPREITILNDFTPETQKLIKDMVQYAVKQTGIWNGSRKETIANKSDVLSQL